MMVSRDAGLFFSACLCLLLALGLLTRTTNASAASDTQPLTWHRLPDMPAGVFSAASSVHQRNVIVTGGLNQAGQASDAIQIMNLDTFQWQTGSVRLPSGVAYHAQVTLRDGSIFIAGGKTGSVLNGLNATRNTWVLSADYQTLTSGPPLPVAADSPTSHLLADGRVIVIAGKLAMIYDPASNTITHRIDLREARREHASVLLPDGRVLVAGGVSRRTLEVIDPVARISVMLAAKLDDPIDDLAAITLRDGRVLLMGGQHSHTGDTIDKCYVVDLSNPSRATINPAPRLGITGGVSDLAVTQLDKWIIAVGGETQQNKADTELATARIIDGHTLQVWSLPDMIVAHDDAQIVADGASVIVIGGYSVNNVRLGPIETKIPTAVHIVERLILPESRLQTRVNPRETGPVAR